MTKTMKGLLLRGPKQMEVIEEAIKEPGEGQVLVRINNFNLCGSDLRIYEGTYSGPMDIPSMLAMSGLEESAAGLGETHKQDPVTGLLPLVRHLSLRSCKNLCEKIEKSG
jgi:threonine dehydrogenase-like Zn-dependent dehydrogenase